MHDYNHDHEFKFSTDKSLLVASFLAVILFIVLFTVVLMVNKSENYTQTQSSAEEFSR